MDLSPSHRATLTMSVAAAVAASFVSAATAGAPDGLQPSDLYRLRAVGDVQLSPDGTRLAYTVINSEQEGRPYSQIWIADTASGRTARLGNESAIGSAPRWAPDGTRLAYLGRHGETAGLLVHDVAAGTIAFATPIAGTNHPLPSSGERIAWAPDGKQVAFISAVPGPEADANGDPMVITRYLYKPTASEGETRFNDNRRTHLFIADLIAGTTRQLTAGNHYEHSIDWSPRGDEIVFVSNRTANPDRVFNYDLFAVAVATGAVRRLTDTPSAEYHPKWSPDGRSIAFAGTTRSLTSSETTMEDTHAWVMRADGTAREEVGRAIDNRQGPPEWDPSGRHLYFTVQERGSVVLVRLPLSRGAAERVFTERGTVGSFSVAGGHIACAHTSASGPSELYVDGRPFTAINRDLLDRRAIAPIEPLTFKSFDGTEIEAFLTIPLGRGHNSRHPLVVMLHGGPHAQQGPAFNSRAQIYAAHGWGVLMVNYRGSTGYGQKLADAIFRDQNGGEARDVQAAVDAALARYPWLDGSRLGVEGGSYGGQLTNWLVTQTPRFKAAISISGISNLVSFNYMAYYHDYLAVEFGGFPHEQGLMDLLWARSPLRYVHRVRTPTLLLHGENDNDVPIAEAEQFYIALMDAGVDTQMIRYPREGHGLRETRHIVDAIQRSIAWYDKHLAES